MATSNEKTAPLRATIIISASLQNHEASRSLQAQQHRIRYSDVIEPGTFIFPQSGIAFMLVATEEFPENPEEAGFWKGLRSSYKFTEIVLSFCWPHSMVKKSGRHCLKIQHSFFGSNLRILPVHNIAEMVKGMLTIAKVTSKPHVVNVRDRMSLARAHFIERSPVWEMLHHMHLG